MSRTHKRCPHCQRSLPFEAFSKNRRLKNGRSSWCRECAVEATRRWRRENPELTEWMNEARRLGERERECADCGESFTFKNSTAIRCPACRRQRKIEQRRELRESAASVAAVDGVRTSGK